MRRSVSFDKSYATPSTRILDNDDIREFIVDELRKLDLVHIAVDENDDETKEALATLSSLHDACSSLEFKINQELFGKKPEETFKKLLDFWMHRFINTMCSNICSFLKRRNVLSNLEEEFLVLRIADVAHTMTYNDYFKALEELKKDDEELTKYYPSAVMPTLMKMFPTLVPEEEIVISEEEIVSAMSEFKFPEIWYNNMDEKGEK